MLTKPQPLHLDPGQDLDRLSALAFCGPQDFPILAFGESLGANVLDILLQKAQLLLIPFIRSRILRVPERWVSAFGNEVPSGKS